MSLVRPVMMLYVFFAIHEVYVEVNKQRRLTDTLSNKVNKKGEHNNQSVN